MIFLVGPGGDIAVASVADFSDPAFADAAAGYTWCFSLAHAFALSRERGRR